MHGPLNVKVYPLLSHSHIQCIQLKLFVPLSSSIPDKNFIHALGLQVFVRGKFVPLL